MPTVFLCHSSVDKPFVYKLDAALRYSYISCWLDERDLEIGDPLHAAIGSAIDRSDFVIPVLSKNSIDSRWVQDELSAALTIEKERGTKKVLPVVIGDESIEVPVFLKDRLHADFRSNPENALRRLVKAIYPTGFLHLFASWDPYDIVETDTRTHLVAFLLNVCAGLDSEGRFTASLPVVRITGYEAELEHDVAMADFEEAQGQGLLVIERVKGVGDNSAGGILAVSCQLTAKGLGILKRHHVINRIDPRALSGETRPSQARARSNSNP